MQRVLFEPLPFVIYINGFDDRSVKRLIIRCFSRDVERHRIHARLFERKVLLQRFGCGGFELFFLNLFSVFIPYGADGGFDICKA